MNDYLRTLLIRSEKIDVELELANLRENNAQIEKVQDVLQMNDYLRALLVRTEKIDVDLGNLREIDAQLVKDQKTHGISIARLRSDTDLLRSGMSEVHGDLRILHPLPYARLHLQKCIEDQIASNDAVNAFIDRCARASVNIYSSACLTLQLRDLKKKLKKAWDARFAAAFLCEPPPTLKNVLAIMAANGYAKEVMRCMNLNQETRSCKKLQSVMREVKGKEGLTQLNYFAKMGLKSSVKRMLSMKGIDINSKDENGSTPLKNAAYDGHLDVCKTLLDYGAEIDKKNINGCTPLHNACQHGHLDVVSLLIARGADIEARAIDKSTPLMRTACDGCDCLKVCTFLLDNHAQIQAADDDGNSIIHLACHYGRLSIISLLISRGANLEAGNNSGLRPLHIAAASGFLKIVKALIVDGNVDMNATSNNGHTPLGDARRNDQSKVAEYLEDMGAIEDEGDADEWEQLPVE